VQPRSYARRLVGAARATRTHTHAAVVLAPHPTPPLSTICHNAPHSSFLLFSRFSSVCSPVCCLFLGLQEATGWSSALLQRRRAHPCGGGACRCARVCRGGARGVLLCGDGGGGAHTIQVCVLLRRRRHTWRIVCVVGTATRARRCVSLRRRRRTLIRVWSLQLGGQINRQDQGGHQEGHQHVLTVGLGRRDRKAATQLDIKSRPGPSRWAWPK
jgi:hypothetical protein